eukprot:653680-Hanusia_phi.AAC.1
MRSEGERRSGVDSQGFASDDNLTEAGSREKKAGLASTARLLAFLIASLSPLLSSALLLLLPPLLLPPLCHLFPSCNCPPTRSCCGCDGPTRQMKVRKGKGKSGGGWGERVENETRVRRE